MEKGDDFKIKPLEVVLSNIFRRILIDEIDAIFDDEVIQLLEYIKDYKRINRFKLYKNYGRYLIKREREY